MAVRLIKLTARIGYHYNFRYCDDDLESLISGIGLHLVSNPVSFESQKIEQFFMIHLAIIVYLLNNIFARLLV